MSSVKYIGNEKYPTLVNVQGGVTVEVGDFLFLDSSINLRNNGDSTASMYAYPIEYFRPATAIDEKRVQVVNYFIGVAISDKYGQTGANNKNVTVATEGVFEFPLKPGRTIYPGDYASAAGTTAASDLFNQYVRRTTDVSYALGVFVERKISAARAYVSINSILNPNKLF